MFIGLPAYLPDVQYLPNSEFKKKKFTEPKYS